MHCYQRNFTESQYAALSKEVTTLNLSKYVGEVASALLDARLKMADIPVCVELCSTLHQRYKDFAPALLAGCTKLVKEKHDEKVSFSYLKNFHLWFILLQIEYESALFV